MWCGVGKWAWLAPIALVAVVCVPLAARAGVTDWRLEAGFTLRAMRGLGALSTSMEPLGGGDFDLHLLRKTGGLGARAAYSQSGLKLRHAGLRTESGYVLPCDLWQSTRWYAAGPDWYFPLPAGRAEVYAMAGVATSARWLESTDTGSWYGPPDVSLVGVPMRVSPLVPVVVAGGSWTGPVRRLWGVGFAFEGGAELQFAGDGVFWDDPPFVDVAGRNVERTRSLAMMGAGIRLGLNCVGWSSGR